ncbi:uncharacterized protein LAJ45_04114 [Morchella importuna]|uniref:uncharacterized protein n=1 Tax=Morchella importuna TaxID=1174673 RepID=UPI001E8DA9EE|nr:uncharacterized protein LAJ45_04114 [Morchella importuna]KAH8151493.1 hypothetical protein LAJ45_04114 [Morchella importuna]
MTSEWKMSISSNSSTPPAPPGLVDVNAYQKAIDSYIKSLNSLVDVENLPKIPPPLGFLSLKVDPIQSSLGAGYRPAKPFDKLAASKKQQTRFEKEGNEEGEGGRKEEKKRKKEGGDQAGIDG